MSAADEPSAAEPADAGEKTKTVFEGRRAKPAKRGLLNMVIAAMVITLCATQLSFETDYQDLVGLGIGLLGILIPPLALGMYRAQSKEYEDITIRLGQDGMRHDAEFTPWSDIEAIALDAEGVFITRKTSAALRLEPHELFEFERAANRYWNEFRARTPAKVPDYLEAQDESEDARQARLDALRGAEGYRRAGVDPRELAALATDPRAPARVRVEAAEILVRVDPSESATLHHSLETIANAELEARLQKTLASET